MHILPKTRDKVGLIEPPVIRCQKKKDTIQYLTLCLRPQDVLLWNLLMLVQLVENYISFPIKPLSILGKKAFETKFLHLLRRTRLKILSGQAEQSHKSFTPGYPRL